MNKKVLKKTFYNVKNSLQNVVLGYDVRTIN